jgi:hypothetical protein
VAVAWVAHGGPFRPGRRGLAGRGPPARAAPRVHSRGAGRGRARLRRFGHAAERRHQPDQRYSRGTADRGRADARRDHRSGVAPHRGPADGLVRLHRVAWRHRPDHRGQRGRRDDASRGRPGPGVTRRVGHRHRGPGSSADRPRPGRGHRRAVPRRRAWRAAGRCPHRGRTARPAWRRPGAGGRRAGRGRHAAAVHPVRIRAEQGLRRGRRRVPQPRAAGRRHRGRGGVRRPSWRPASSRRRGHRGRHRAEQPAADHQPPGGQDAEPADGSAGRAVFPGDGKPVGRAAGWSLSSPA